VALAIGTRLGPYEVQAPLGAGGMGEVYRARDTRLDRTVAVKVLPPDLAADSQFRERFEREARAISRLSHPNICTLHDVGHEGGIDFLVMEFLDGETLESRLAKGPLKIDEGLQVGIQIASALDIAHRAGIVHRDLKPGNIFLLGSTGRTSATSSGAVSAKLLDFGLAKHAAPAIAVSGVTGLPTTPPVTTPSLTAQGTILGTFQYMAPEQIEGQEADARTDIFAFGAVLYEMFTGRKAFEGKTRASLIGAILKDEPPPLTRDQPLAPAALNRIVATCLAKEPEDRWQTMRDLLRELKWVADGTSSSESAAAASATSVNRSSSTFGHLLPWAVSAVLAIAAVAMVIVWAPWRAAPPPPQPLRFSAELGADTILITQPVGGPGASLALSPDGALLAFVGQKAGAATSQLYLRRLGQLQATPLNNTDGARDPFFSPDGEWVGFFAGGSLKKVSVTGGASMTLCEIGAPNTRGGAWGEDGTIAFSTITSGRSVIKRLSESGGKPEALTTFAEGEVTHRWPQMLPDGKGILFTASASASGQENGNLVVQSPDGSRKVVQTGGYFGRYVRGGSASSAGRDTGGHLMFIHEGTLFAVPFDLDRLETTGQPVPAVEDVSSSSGTGGAHLALSRTGMFVFLQGQSTGGEQPVSWMDRQGKTTPLMPAAKVWTNPKFSPDGRRLALEITDGTQDDVWVYDWARDTLTRLTFDAASDRKPVWTPDGRRIVFVSSRANNATPNLYWQMADGSTAAPQRLTESKNAQSPASWHPSGRYFAFGEIDARGQSGLMILEMEGDDASGWKPGKTRPYLDDPTIYEVEPTFSPDGRWIAYMSNEVTQNDVFVRPFPDASAGKWQISTGGGNTPTWSRTKNELLYRSPDQHIMVASYSVEGNAFKPDKPRPWSERRIAPRPRQRPFDLHPDGERIAAAAGADEAAMNGPTTLVFVLNFAEELRRITGR